MMHKPAACNLVTLIKGQIDCSVRLHAHRTHASSQSGLGTGYMLRAVQVMQRFRTAAIMGDAKAVRSMLQKHSIRADTVHRDHGSHLVLDIARDAAQSVHSDRMLSAVLRVLDDAGWSLDVKDSNRRNALHLLASRDPLAVVSARIRFLIQAVTRQPPRPDNMLAAADENGQLPEDAATTWMSCDQPVKAELRKHRLAIERACESQC